MSGDVGEDEMPSTVVEAVERVGAHEAPTSAQSTGSAIPHRAAAPALPDVPRHLLSRELTLLALDGGTERGHPPVPVAVAP